MSVPNPATTDWVPIYAGAANFNYLGDYIPSTLYKDGDIVMYNGMPWLAVKETNTPPEPFPLPSLSSIPSGSGMMWFSNIPPEGWAILDGATLTNAQTVYPELWANVDPAWKSGANIVLPNLKGKIPVGRDSGQAEFDTLGETMGAKTHQLSVAEMPSHAHGVTDPSHTHYGAHAAAAYGDSYTGMMETAGAVIANVDGAYTGISIQANGGGGAHNNLQPGIVVNYMIKL